MAAKSGAEGVAKVGSGTALAVGKKEKMAVRAKGGRPRRQRAATEAAQDARRLEVARLLMEHKNYREIVAALENIRCGLGIGWRSVRRSGEIDRAHARETGCLREGLARNQRHEARTAILRKLHAELSAVQLCQLPGDGESEAHSRGVGRGMTLVVALEDVRSLLERNAGTAISHGDLDTLVGVAHVDIDWVFLPTVPGGILEEVSHYLGYSLGVNERSCGSGGDAQPHPSGAVSVGDGVTDQRGDID